MSENSRRPIGRVVAKNRDNKDDRLTVGTIWPGRYEGQHQFSLQGRVKIEGNWENLPCRLIVEHPDGEITITGGKEGTHFLDYYPSDREEDSF